MPRIAKRTRKRNAHFVDGECPKVSTARETHIVNKRKICKLDEGFNKLLNRLVKELLEIQSVSKKEFMILKRIKYIAQRLTKNLPSAKKRRSGRGESLQIHNEGGTNHLSIPPSLCQTFHL